MKTTLQAFHTDAAEACVKIAQAHRAAESCHRELGKADAKSYHRDLADAHSAAAEGFTAMAESHIECCQTLESIPVATESRTNADERGPRDKTERDILNLNAIAPDGVMQVFLKSPSKGRLVPRTGVEIVETSGVPEQFLELIKLD